MAEYLPILTCRSKWFEKAKPLAVGNLVMVVDPANLRNVWSKGKVIKVNMSEDSQVRRAKVDSKRCVGEASRQVGDSRRDSKRGVSLQQLIALLRGSVTVIV